MIGERRCIKSTHLRLNCMKLEVISQSSSSARTQICGFREPRNFSPAGAALSSPCKLQYDENANSFWVHIPSWERRVWLWRIGEIDLLWQCSPGKTDPAISLRLLTMHTEFVKNCSSVCTRKNWQITAMPEQFYAPCTSPLHAAM